MARLTFYVVLLLFFRPCFSVSRCYYPNGSEAPDDYPCDPDADESVCCGQGFGSTCMSNKLCQGSDGNTVRGTCTDQNWSSPLCPMFCLGADSGGTDMVSCSNVTKSDTSYCCDHSENCCNSGVGRFEVEPSHPDIWAKWNTKSSSYNVVGTMYKEPTTSTLAQESATSTKLLQDTTMSSTQASSETNVPGSSPVLSTGAIVGIVVGSVALGLFIISAALFLIWKKRRGQSKENLTQEAPYWLPPYQAAGANEMKYKPQVSELPGRGFASLHERFELPGGH